MLTIRYPYIDLIVDYDLLLCGSEVDRRLADVGRRRVAHVTGKCNEWCVINKRIIIFP